MWHAIYICAAKRSGGVQRGASAPFPLGGTSRLSAGCKLHLCQPPSVRSADIAFRPSPRQFITTENINALCLPFSGLDFISNSIYINHVNIVSEMSHKYERVAGDLMCHSGRIALPISTIRHVCRQRAALQGVWSAALAVKSRVKVFFEDVWAKMLVFKAQGPSAPRLLSRSYVDRAMRGGKK